MKKYYDLTGGTDGRSSCALFRMHRPHASTFRPAPRDPLMSGGGPDSKEPDYSTEPRCRRAEGDRGMQGLKRSRAML